MIKNAAMFIAVLACACACTNSPSPAHHQSPVLDAKSMYGVDDLYAVPAEAFRAAVERGSIPEAKQPAIKSALSNANDLLVKVVAAHTASDATTFYASLSELSSLSVEINVMIADAELPAQQ